MALVANAGSHNIGQCDDIQQLNDICYKYRMWLHLDGIYLSTLILYSVPTAVQVYSFFAFCIIFSIIFIFNIGKKVMMSQVFIFFGG